MTGVCIRHSEIPGSSRLFVDFLYDFARVAPFYQHDPSNPDSLNQAISEINYPASRRAAVVEALRVTNGDHPSLDLLAQPNTVAILTGQQVGLYGGPAYTLYKALSAIRLAQELTQAGKPAVPIFWLATEDHDVEEIRSAAFWDSEITAEAASDGRPAGLHTLLGLPADLPLSEEIAALARRHYQNGKTFGEAFLGLVQELLAPLGLLFADPLEPKLRAVGAEFLSEAARKAPELSEKLVARNKQLIAAGYTPQVHFEKNETSLFFLLQNQHRQQLKFNASTYNAEEMAAKGASLSPNALLRPVWQDWLFPTAALIGGPGELAYFAQSEVLYKVLLGRMPVVLPRAFFTIVDPKSAKTIDRFRVRYADMLHNEEHVRLTLAQRLVPPDVTQALQNAERNINQSLSTLGAKLEHFDPTLAKALENSQNKIRYQFSKNHSKIVLEMLRKNEQAQRQAAHISHRLAPHGHLQERHYSLLAMLSDYGLEFIPTILENIHYGCHDHHVLLLG
jgi:bacillithiol biosynthesis cysteine-adding enzyme BshC